MKQIPILLFILMSLNLWGQKQDYIWMFGGSSLDSFSTALDFQYSFDSVHIINRDMPISDSYGSICSPTGELLFYTNGLWIADSSHQLMLNGDSLNPGQVANDYRSIGLGYPLSESALVLNKPHKDSIFELFHLGLEYGGQGILVDKLYHTTINMNGNGGKGEVNLKNILLVQDTFYPQLEAVQHGNGDNWWIIVPEIGLNGFFRFLLTWSSPLLIRQPYRRL